MRTQKRWIAGVVVALLLSGSTTAQAEPLSMPLVYAGFATMMIGGALIIPQGVEHHIVGRTYCTSENSSGGIDVKRGACEPLVKDYRVAAWVGGIGGGMLVVGLLPKDWFVSPMIGPHVKGVAGAVRWGGQ
jgi:hypothetical protein